MPRGQMTRHEVLSKVYTLKRELKENGDVKEVKTLADDYLNKVLDNLNTFRY